MGPEWWTEAYLWLEEADPEFSDLPDEEQHERILDAMRASAEAYLDMEKEGS